MLDMDGGKLVDDVGLPVMIRRIEHKSRDFVQCWSDTALMILLRVAPSFQMVCSVRLTDSPERLPVHHFQNFQVHPDNCQSALWKLGLEYQGVERIFSCFC